MILDVRAILPARLPALFHEHEQISIAKVQTTRSLYLAFSKAQSFPVCVAQFGTQGELASLDEVLRGLHTALPHMVPCPLLLTQWRGGVWMHVQSGLEGVPWFSLPRTLRTFDDWLRLRVRALATLREFQAAVHAEAKWSSAINPGTELRLQLEVCRSSGWDVPTIVVARVDECAVLLERLGFERHPWQHGDYCFNNLVVSPERLGLIDFEEFGGTSMPLHDEFSLAFSSDEFMGHRSDAPRLADQMAACLADRPELESIPRRCVEGFLFHHLLWRLNQSAARPGRAEIAAVLRRHLEHLAADPSRYLASVWRLMPDTE